MPHRNCNLAERLDLKRAPDNRTSLCAASVGADYRSDWEPHVRAFPVMFVTKCRRDNTCYNPRLPSIQAGPRRMLHPYGSSGEEL